MAKVVVVTGASAGVGRATVRAFALEGAHLGLIARNRERLERARREVEDVGGRALVLPADVADARAVEDAADRVERELGPVDIWVNNAMATIFARVVDTRPEEVRRATEVTYLGTVYGTMAALRYMYPRNRGVIVQVGSALAYRSIPLQAAYCGAKHAIVGFTDSLRSELIADGKDIHVTVVHLPALNTPQHSWCRSRLPRHPQPVPPIYQPEIAAEAIVWASKQRLREIQIGWPTVAAILGQKVAPGWLDHYLADYNVQQTNEPANPNRLDNLFESVPGAWGAHGEFDEESAAFSVQAWASMHRNWLAPIAGGLAGLAFGAAFERKRKQGQSADQATGLRSGARGRERAVPLKRS
ncbi:MAG: SDR family oxidoreductase [Bryobacteraceae bacterium]|nr:SDR family oxidoreductase [Bryobacteraceae bacterium]